MPDWTVWTHPCPGGEQADQIHARTDMVLSTVRSQLPERDVILIGHGHFSRALIARWLELPVTEGKRFALSPAHTRFSVTSMAPPTSSITTCRRSSRLEA